MTDKTQINIRVLEETKSRWDDALESPEYNSLTHLITLSVKKELSSDGSTPTDTLDAGATAEVVQDEVVPALEQIRRGVDNLDGRIDRLEAEVQSKGPEYDIETAVLDVLPVPSDDQKIPTSENETDGYIDHPIEWAATVDDISELLESRGIVINKQDIRDALDGLADSLGFVKKIASRDQGRKSMEARYWRVE